MKVRIVIAVILLSLGAGCKSPTTSTIEVCRQDIIDGNIYLNDCNIYEIKE